jgi:lipopolysaccharide export system permease protein
MLNRFNVYVTWEVTKLFTVTLVGFNTLIMLVFLGQQLISNGLGPSTIFKLLPYLLPISLQFALPATLLFALCSVYGRISADNEVVSVAAAGVPPMRIMSLPLATAFLLSLIAVWLNDIAEAWGHKGLSRVALTSAEQVAYGFLASQGSYTSSENFSIHVHGIGADGRELIRPTINPPAANGGERVSIKAKSARLRALPERDVLAIELVDAEVRYGDDGGYKAIKPGLFQYEIKLADLVRKGNADNRQLTMREIPGQIRQERQSIEQHEQLVAARVAMGLTVGRYDWFSDERTGARRYAVIEGRSRITRLSLEPWRRWASGFSCFFFAWVGIPFSIWLRSADPWVSFGASFLPILLTYFPLFVVSLGLSKSGDWHPSSIWLGNIVLLLCGLYWMWRVARR